MRGAPLRCPYLYTIKKNKSVSRFLLLTNLLYEEKEMEKKQVTILIVTICVSLLLGVGAGILYVNQTNPKLEKAALEQEMEQQLQQEAEKLSE